MTAKLELYRVFREVAETGNISAAAQNLYISQSAVSQSVKQLEGALQTRLFIRSPRGVTLTDDGQMLFEHVRSAMGLLETGEEKLAQTRALQMGKLVIGASDTVTSQFLLPHLDSFHKKYPNIHIQIISGRSHKVLGLLRSGKVDLVSFMDHTPGQGQYRDLLVFGDTLKGYRDVSDEDAEKTTELVRAKCGGSVEVSHISGGQPVYYYMISVE